MSDQGPLIPKHGGYRKLKSFQMAQLVYDVTVRFCDRYLDRRSRTHDQTEWVHANAFSVVQGLFKFGAFFKDIQGNYRIRSVTMSKITMLAIIITAWLACAWVVGEAAPPDTQPTMMGSRTILAAAEGPAPDAPNAKPAETHPAAGNDNSSISSKTVEDAPKGASAEGAQPSIRADEQSAGKTKPAPGIKWESENQRTKCESYRQNLKDKFLRARYFSIQGDPCATAEHAKAFLDLMDTCTRECPKDFLKKTDYSDRTLRNIKLLHKHGSERCLK